MALHNSQELIRIAASREGWTTTCPNPLTAEHVTYRKGTRYIRVTFDVRGAVREVHWQTGSYGGRSLTATDTRKANRTLDLLQATRWTTDTPTRKDS